MCVCVARTFTCTHTQIFLSFSTPITLSSPQFVSLKLTHYLFLYLGLLQYACALFIRGQYGIVCRIRPKWFCYGGPFRGMGRRNEGKYVLYVYVHIGEYKDGGYFNITSAIIWDVIHIIIILTMTPIYNVYIILWKIKISKHIGWTLHNIIWFIDCENWIKIIK